MDPTRPQTPPPHPPSRGGAHASRSVSLGIALLASAGFLVSAREGPLPAPAWAAAFLFLLAAVECDVRMMRIPNALTLPSLALALGLSAFLGGLEGLLAALAGAGTALGLFFVPFALRWVGAGDVKALMVLGALVGADALLPALWWMLVIGGLMAVAFVAIRGGVLELVRRWGRMAWLTLASGRPVYLAPPSGSAGAQGIPFAVAIALGATASQLWGTPWL